MSVKSRIFMLKAFAFLLLIGPGLIMITGPHSPLLPLVNSFLDFAHQPLDGVQKISDSAGFLLNAILGGILVGFGVMIWMVAEYVFRADQGLGRKLILVPLLCWFSCDSLGSILTGAWFNAVLNAGILSLFLIPLLISTATVSAD